MAKKRQRSPSFERFENNPILKPSDWPYPVNSVFNAAAAQMGDETILLVRAEDHSGFSHLSVARSLDGISDWRIDPEPVLEADPENHPEELWGIEDPRVMYLSELKKWVVAYTAFSRGGPMVALALTDDFRTYERLGPVTAPQNKDAAILPVRIGGRWVMIHRPLTTFHGMEGHMWLSYSPDLIHWGEHKILMEARAGTWWDAYKIGLGPPPLETDAGWLVMYHGVRTTASGALYRVGLALLDREDPMQVLNRSDEWIFAPQEPYERYGDVADVVFPCGWIWDKLTDVVRIYYGAADTCMALATTKMSDLLEYIVQCPRPASKRYY